MGDKRIELGERAFIDQRVDAFVGRSFTTLMLLLDRLRARRRLR